MEQTFNQTSMRNQQKNMSGYCPIRSLGSSLFVFRKVKSSMASIANKLAKGNIEAEYNKKHLLLKTVGYLGKKTETFYKTVLGADYDKEQLIYHEQGFKGYNENGTLYTRRVAYLPIGYVLDKCADSSTTYFYPCAFNGSSPSEDKIKKVYALVIDLDRVSLAQCAKLLRNMCFGFEPTAIVNSGSGLHLYYVFEKPIEVYTNESYKLKALQIRDKLKRIYNGLRQVFIKANVCETVDNGGLAHGFRMVGTRTKQGQECFGYGYMGGYWTVERLEKALGLKEKPKEPKAIIQKPSYHTEGKVKKLATAKRGWYGTVASTLPETMHNGNRQNSLFALCIIAKKCRISMSALISDIENICNEYNANNPSDRIKPQTKTEKNPTGFIMGNKALRGYSDNYLYVKSETLEQYLGYKFTRRKAKPRKTRAEANREIAANKRARNVQRVKDYLQENPNAKNKTIAEALHLSPQVVGDIVWAITQK